MIREHRILAVTAAALCGAAPDALSPFERDLIDEISARRKELGEEAALSPVEIEQLTHLVEVMKADLRARIAAQSETFGQILATVRLNFITATANLGADVAALQHERAAR